MRKIILIGVLLFFTIGGVFAQDSTIDKQEIFTYNAKGLIPKYVVTEIAEGKKEVLFKETINWIKNVYKNPDEVIKTTIDNGMVRFEGSQKDLICFTTLGTKNCYFTSYTIEVEFKDNKYKFTPIAIEYRVPSSDYSAATTVKISFNDGSRFYRGNGKIRNLAKGIPLSIETLFNELNKDLLKHLSKEDEEASDDW
jgi:hypothetical protein